MFYKGKKVLVTGGAGFVGSHITEELLKNGAEVTITVHKRKPPVFCREVKTVSADLTGKDACIKALKNIQYVFHAAGSVSPAGVSALAVMDAINTNLALLLNMLQAAWECKTERFLVFSSSTGYPLTDWPVKEEEMWSGPPHSSYFGYGWSKRYMEKIAEYTAMNSSLRIALVRPTAVYGPGDNFNPASCHVIPALIRKAAEKHNPFEVWGTGNEIRDFMHIRDLARGCLLMLEKKADCDPVNIGCGQSVSIRQTAEIILKAAGYCEQPEIIFNSVKPVTIPVRAVDITKAKKILGFKPQISLASGIQETFDWWMKTIASGAD